LAPTIVIIYPSVFFQIAAAEKLKGGVERKLENIIQASELRKIARPSSSRKNIRYLYYSYN